MSLESGTYFITSKIGNADGAIGRGLHEDLSLLPKRVVLLPPGVEYPKWVVEKLDNGYYILKIGGTPTSKIDDLLFAVLLPEPAPTQWAIIPQFHQGENNYTIEVADQPGPGAQWALLENEAYTQVSVKSEPNTGLNEIFIITPSSK